MPDRIVDVLPKRGLIPKYIEYTGASEICPRFNVFSLFGALGSIVRKKVYLNRSSTGNVIIYPNPWIILVAPQGIGHKSSAIRLGRKFLEQMEDKPKILASKLTPEALIKSLASQVMADKTPVEVGEKQRLVVYKRKAQGLLYSSEFGVLLGREKYNMGMIALLTDLYDCPEEWNSETVMRGDQRLYEVCLSILGASTPDWMQSMLPTDAFKGGFMSRLILVGYPEGWNKRVGDLIDPPASLKKSIVEDFEYISKLKGEIKWSEKAKKYFVDWYMSLPEPIPGPQAAYLERKQDHALKLAVLVQLCFREGFEITKESIEIAFNILDSVQPETLKMIDYISVEPGMRAVQRILELLDKGEKTEAILLDEAWKYLKRPGEFDDIIGMLIRARRVDIVPKKGETVYKLKRRDPLK